MTIGCHSNRSIVVPHRNVFDVHHCLQSRLAVCSTIIDNVEHVVARVNNDITII